MQANNFFITKSIIMAANIITIEDLHNFKMELISEIKEIISTGHSRHPQKKWLKSKEVRQLLNISPGTLQNLRVTGTLSFTQIGGILLYSQDDINDILEENKKNLR
jgi:hypothetical protein